MASEQADQGVGPAANLMAPCPAGLPLIRLSHSDQKPGLLAKCSLSSPLASHTLISLPTTIGPSLITYPTQWGQGWTANLLQTLPLASHAPDGQPYSDQRQGWLAPPLGCWPPICNPPTNPFQGQAGQPTAPPHSLSRPQSAP